MSNYRQFTVRCACGNLTSKAYARAHNGKCKECATGIPREPKASPEPHYREFKRKHGRCEDAPCCGCCGPQGDGDFYGVSAMENAMEPRY